MDEHGRERKILEENARTWKRVEKSGREWKIMGILEERLDIGGREWEKKTTYGEKGRYFKRIV